MCRRRQRLGAPGNPDRVLVNNSNTLQEFREALLKSIIETPDNRRIAHILLTWRVEMEDLLHSRLLRSARLSYRSAAPSRISSVARRTTRSPGRRLPETSTKSPSVTPFTTLTHSARPLLSRMTNVRSLVVTTLVRGVHREGCSRRTGHFTVGYIPGESEPSRLITSNSTAMVRVVSCSACATRATVPE